MNFVSPQLIKKNSNFSAELGLEPGSSDPETIALPMSYKANDEELSFALIQITNISIYVLVKNAMLSDLNDAYSNGKNKTSILYIPTLLLKSKNFFYKNNMATQTIFLFLEKKIILLS